MTVVVYRGTSATSPLRAFARAWRGRKPFLTVTPGRRGWVNIRLDFWPAAVDIRGRGRYHAEHLRNRWVQRGWIKPKSLSGVGPTAIEVIAREERVDQVVASLTQFAGSPSYFKAL